MFHFLQLEKYIKEQMKEEIQILICLKIKKLLMK